MKFYIFPPGDNATWLSKFIKNVLKSDYYNSFDELAKQYSEEYIIENKLA